MLTPAWHMHRYQSLSHLSPIQFRQDPTGCFVDQMMFSSPGVTLDQSADQNVWSVLLRTSMSQWLWHESRVAANRNVNQPVTLSIHQWDPLKMVSERCPNTDAMGWLKAPTHRPDSNLQPTAFIRPLCCLSSDPFSWKAALNTTLRRAASSTVACTFCTCVRCIKLLNSGWR